VSEYSGESKTESLELDPHRKRWAEYGKKSWVTSIVGANCCSIARSLYLGTRDNVSSKGQGAARKRQGKKDNSGKFSPDQNEN